MLTNSDIYLCSNFKSQIYPASELTKLSSIPKNLERTSTTTFMYCDTPTNSSINNNNLVGTSAGAITQIIQMNINNQQTRIIQQFQGCYTSWDFCNDYTLLVNREGNFLFYNLLSKNVFQAEMQHPGQFADVDIMHTQEHLITCGGCVKNTITNNSERIIKVWSIDNGDCLNQRARINTGHKKAIQCSFLMNKTHVVTMSLDKSLRFTNIVSEEIDSIIKTDTDFLTGCQMDYHSIIAGGLDNTIKAYDKRLNRCISNINAKIPKQIIQVVNMTRFTDNTILVSNINQIFCLDIRTWKLSYLNQYQGERISTILTLNESEFIIGNREKTMQHWKAK